jgi:antitoxin (DNA-binding transcriptional repressor) of toxin-antitoxin stability system
VIEVLERHAGEAEQRIAELEDRQSTLLGLLDRAAAGELVRLCRLTADGPPVARTSSAAWTNAYAQATSQAVGTS